MAAISGSGGWDDALAVHPSWAGPELRAHLVVGRPGCSWGLQLPESRRPVGEAKGRRPFRRSDSATRAR